MICIDVDKREIVFSREDAEPRRFPLISGHVCPCPECATVIRAGFEAAEPVVVHAFEEPPAADPEHSRYDTAHENGVQIVSLGERARMRRTIGRSVRSCCRYFAYTKPTLRGCLAELLREVLGIWVWPDRIDTERAREAPGLRFAPDILSVSEPIVLFDREEFAAAHTPPESERHDHPRREVWRERLAEDCGFTGQYVADDDEEVL